MVGIFQLFGINFIFWASMGILRFISERVHAQWKASHTDSLGTLFIASLGGVVLSFALLFLFFLNFDAAGMSRGSFVIFFSGLGLWLAAVAAGAYFAARMYVIGPYTASFVVGTSLIAIGTILFFTHESAAFFAPHTTFNWTLWMASSFAVAIFGGYIARRMNATEAHDEKAREEVAKIVRVLPEDVAIVIAAYNEELTIGATLESLKQIADPKNIYVGSDGSKDNTVEVARAHGVNVDDIQPNGGKSKALTYILEHNKLIDRYKAVFFVDADLRVNPNFFKEELYHFDDPEIVAVVAHAVSYWPEHILPRYKYFFTAYRTRLWRVLQYSLRYGQTWKYTNMSPIVPGGGSIYRTEALRHIRIHVPGLIIEDFNITFNIHHQRLGKIAFNPGSHVIDQEPFSLRDYTKQVFRWYLGFFQTVRLHGVWPSWFFLSMFLFLVELTIGSILFLLIPFFLMALLVSGQSALDISIGTLSMSVSYIGIIVLLFVIDYIVTIIVTLIERKPLLLIYGFGFFLLRYLEGVVFLYAMIKGLFSKSKNDGRWVSPKRVAYSVKSAS